MPLPDYVQAEINKRSGPPPPDSGLPDYVKAAMQGQQVEPQPQDQTINRFSEIDWSTPLSPPEREFLSNKAKGAVVSGYENIVAPTIDMIGGAAGALIGAGGGALTGLSAGPAAPVASPVAATVGATAGAGLGYGITRQATQNVGDLIKTWAGHPTEKKSLTKRSGGAAFDVVLGAMGEGLPAAGAEAYHIGKTAMLQGKLAPRLSAKMNKIIDYGITKGTGYYKKGKDSLKLLNQYTTNARNAVKSVIANKENLVFKDIEGNEIVGRLPRNLYEFGQAVSHVKNKLVTAYTEMAKKSAGMGTEVGTYGAQRALLNIIEDESLARQAPEVIEYAGKKLATLQKSKPLDPVAAQTDLKLLNESLDDFYSNPNAETRSRAFVDSVVAHELRQAQYETINKSVGEGYKQLRNEFGALKSIEDDIFGKHIITARQRPNGFFDYGKMFEAFHGVKAVSDIFTKGDPTATMATIALKGAKDIIKRRNDPNFIIGNMFNKVNKLQGKLDSVEAYLVARGLKIGNYNIDDLEKAGNIIEKEAQKLIEYKRWGKTGQPLMKPKALHGQRQPTPGKPNVKMDVLDDSLDYSGDVKRSMGTRPDQLAMQRKDLKGSVYNKLKEFTPEEIAKLDRKIELLIKPKPLHGQRQTIPEKPSFINRSTGVSGPVKENVKFPSQIINPMQKSEAARKSIQKEVIEQISEKELSKIAEDLLRQEGLRPTTDRIRKLIVSLKQKYGIE